MGIHRLYKSYSPYRQENLSTIDTVQSADVTYIAHSYYPLTKLTRAGHTDWTFSTVTFGPTISAPVGPIVTAYSPNMTGYVGKTYNYVATAVSDTSPTQESRASVAFSTTNDLTLVNNYNEITLPARPAGVDRWVIYKEKAGSFGYIGSTAGTSFQDGNPEILATLSDSPPQGDNPFDGEGNYPGTVALHQQRLIAGRTINVPNGIWGSQSGDLENMDASRPVKADDAFAFALVSEKVNAVNQLASFDSLIALSGDAIFSIDGTDGNVITANGGINPKRQTGRGASRLDPILIDTVLFFTPSKNATVRTLGYSFEQQGITSNDVGIFSSHFFENNNIISWCYQEEPYSAIWAVRDDGALLCFTWQQEQGVWGWSLCEVDGNVEQVGVIFEGGYDRLYLLVRRTLNGVERLFHERMALPHGDDYTTACHLDCAISQIYDPPQNVVGQLWHLNGLTVSATFDGFAAHDLVVTDGQLALPNGYEATFVTVGLRYSGEIETLPPVLSTNGGTAHVNRQQIDSIVVRTLDTKGIKVGVSGAPLEQLEERDGTAVEGLPDVTAIDYAVTVPGDWKDTSTVIVVQDEPFPCHVTGVFYDMNVSRE